ncbi:MAG TPA: GNAT family N-acetyltransferase, partial [Acholeplasmataceae bacterium]|nr:GNAT family N-acetyltransferase [Acholeplasmataceae bacterium]
MTLQDIIKCEKSYVSMFSSIEEKPFGYIATDINQRDKYYHNYVDVIKRNYTREDITSYIEKTKPIGFTILRCEHDIKIDDDILKDAIADTDAYYMSPIEELNITPKTEASITVVDPKNDEDFFQFLYDESKAYGLSYAEGNIKRQKEILYQHRDRYRYYQVKVNHQVIGSLNVCTVGDFAKLDDFSILESMQRKGYGSRLMHHVIEDLKQQGI